MMIPIEFSQQSAGSLQCRDTLRGQEDVCVPLKEIAALLGDVTVIYLMGAEVALESGRRM